MFRTGNFAAPVVEGHPEKGHHPTWPYPISQRDVNRAREYSRNFWRSNTWSKAVHPLEWLVEKFKPIPGWHIDEDPIDKGKSDGPPAT
jgi:hypothetical protein